MIVRRLALSRRTLLRGAGTALGLPLLDAMVPVLTPRTRAASPVLRFGVVYVPNGVVMTEWTPAGPGGALTTLAPSMAPLEPFRSALTVITGLRNGPPNYAVHGAASTRFLTTEPPVPSTGSVVEAGVSLDQVLAREAGKDTQLASLELSLEAPFTGVCDIGSSCVYTDTIAWRNRTTPLPMEHNPRAVFERLFGEADTTGRDARAARLTARRSILDSVATGIRDLVSAVGPGDRAKLEQYLDGVRDVERQIQRTEEQGARDLPALERPVGVPATFEAHARLMFDLQVLAFQSDLTRVTTCMLGRELSGRSYPEAGVRDAHHPTSHHQGDAVKLRTLARINQHHTAQFGYFLSRLAATPDGPGSLLDHCTLLYGAGMSDGNSHSPDDLPVVLAGGGVGGEGARWKGGRHLRVEPGTLIGNLHATLLPKLGVPVTSFGNSTGVLADL
ncbi:MAG: DUF1552 domain-containing protein [Vicinamibacterales bacterium]